MILNKPYRIKMLGVKSRDMVVTLLLLGTSASRNKYCGNYLDVDDFIEVFHFIEIKYSGQ